MALPCWKVFSHSNPAGQFTSILTWKKLLSKKKIVGKKKVNVPYRLKYFGGGPFLKEGACKAFGEPKLEHFLAGWWFLAEDWWIRIWVSNFIFNSNKMSLNSFNYTFSNFQSQALKFLIFNSKHRSFAFSKNTINSHMFKFRKNMQTDTFTLSLTSYCSKFLILVFTTISLPILSSFFN